MHLKDNFFVFLSLVRFPRLFGPNAFPTAGELVSILGVKRCRGRAHLTSLRERRQSPEGNRGGW